MFSLVEHQTLQLHNLGIVGSELRAVDPIDAHKDIIEIERGQGGFGDRAIKHLGPLSIEAAEQHEFSIGVVLKLIEDGEAVGCHAYGLISQVLRDEFAGGSRSDIYGSAVYHHTRGKLCNRVLFFSEKKLLGVMGLLYNFFGCGERAFDAAAHSSNLSFGGELVHIAACGHGRYAQQRGGFSYGNEPSGVYQVKQLILALKFEHFHHFPQ